jgi:hypothetical protein
VVDDYPDTNVANMAALVMADNYLGGGCNELFVNKVGAQEQLNKAIEKYQLVRQQSNVPSLLERAAFGLARAREAKGDAANIQQAEKLYEEVATKWPKGAFAVAATERLNDLKRPATKRLYAQFAKFDPRPAFSREGGQRPDFDLNNLPDEPSSYVPEKTLDLKLDKKSSGKQKAKEVEKKPAAPAGKK